MPFSFLFVGDSHLTALRNAYEAERPPDITADFISFGEPEFAPQASSPGGQRDVMSVEVTSAIVRSGADVLVSFVGGNAHNVLGLVNQSPAFDFVLADQPDLPLDRSAEILPCDVVRAALKRVMAGRAGVLKSLRSHVRQPMVHPESPPPIPSTDHITRNPGRFAARIDQRGIAPAVLRYKLWRLHSTIVRQTCEELDIHFLPVPEETLDADGMMIERAWEPDPTHGNAWYGSRVLRQLLRIAEDQGNGRARGGRGSIQQLA